MDKKLIAIMETILRNVDALNAELMRLYGTEQFRPLPECYDIITRIRGSCSDVFYNTVMLEKLMNRFRAEQQAGAQIPDPPQ